MDEKEKSRLLAQIFSKESDQRIAAIDGLLGEIEASSATPLRLETLHREFHSLKGAARVLKIESITRIALAAEQRARVYMEQGLMDAAGLEDIRNAYAEVTKTVSAFTSGDPLSEEEIAAVEKKIAGEG